MRFFNWKKRKSRKEEQLEGKKTVGEYLNEMDQPALVVPKPFHAETLEEVSQFVESAMAQIDLARKAVDDAKDEYESVTNALKDIQSIGEIPEETAAEIREAADKIQSLNAERESFQKSPNKISEDCYQKMEAYGEDIREMMKKLDEDEKYAQIIQTDMQTLEGEKVSIRYDVEEAQDKLEVYKKLTGGVLFLLAIAVTFFFVCLFVLKERYDLVMYGALAVIGVLLVLIFAKNESTRKDLKLAERKLNKAISLLNRAKVRYVNITNSIEYQYTKYNVTSAYELNRNWGLYLEMKRERELYRHSSQELHDAEKELIAILAEFQIQDPRIWVHRAPALLDSREMVEVRHELNVRRQKLRNNMEYNRQVWEKTSQSIKDFAKLNKNFAEDVMYMVSQKQK